MMNPDASLLNDDEVLFVPMGRVLMANPTFKVSEFLDALAQVISDNEPEWSEDCEGWFLDGLPCEVLRFTGQGWQRGRVRIRLEFTPQVQKLLKEQSPRRSAREARAPRDEGSARLDDAYARSDEGYYRDEEDY